MLPLLVFRSVELVPDFVKMSLSCKCNYFCHLLYLIFSKSNIDSKCVWLSEEIGVSQISEIRDAPSSPFFFSPSTPTNNPFFHLKLLLPLPLSFSKMATIWHSSSSPELLNAFLHANRPEELVGSHSIEVRSGRSSGPVGPKEINKNSEKVIQAKKLLEKATKELKELDKEESPVEEEEKPAKR